MNSSEYKNEVKVQKLYKIFGEKTPESLKYAQKGLTREEIMKKTGDVVALKNINLSVKPGEIFCIMGLSGSGKSTLLRCINRLYEPTSGEIFIKDKKILDYNKQQLKEIRRESLGMVFQNFALFPHRTVLENVTFGLEIKKLPRKEQTQKGKEVLKTVGLEGWENKKTGELSGGMQQRVGFARALAIDPDLLLMDEPFSALDPLIRNELQDQLLKLHQKMKKTIFFVTHDLNEAIKVGDRITIINSEGKIIQIGTPEQIILKPRDEYVKKFIKDIDRPSVIRIESIMKPPKTTITLEEAFEKQDKVNKVQRNNIFVTHHQKLKGVISKKNIKKGEVESSIKQANFVNKLNTIKDVLPYIMNSNEPVAVINDKGILEGEISRESISKILAKNI